MPQTTVVEPTTCSTCPNFKNFHEPNGRGWCQLFDQKAREHHQQTNDCILSSDTSSEKELITIEFAPEIHQDENQYSYPHPLFVFGSEVEVKGSFSFPSFKVIALELVETKTSSGKLLAQPSWKYRISNGIQAIWKEQSALLSSEKYQIETTPIFTTENQESEHDLPHSEHQVGDKVKVIDFQEHHSEWAIFEILDRKYSHDRDSIFKYSGWYFKLPSFGKESFWVYESEICDAQMSFNVSTEDIF